MEERLLFDGIAQSVHYVAPRGIELALLVKPNPANAGESYRDRAAVSAGIAPHPIAVNRLPQLGRARIPSDDTRKRRHT